MNHLDPGPEPLRRPSWPAAGGLTCHTPQPTPPVEDDDDDEEEDDDRGSDGGNIDPDDDEGTLDDDEDDDDDTLWTRRVSRPRGGDTATRSHGD
jgi:hypothetical protein